MCRHLFVPIDGTDLSVELVGNAVALARPLAACITFFHEVAAAASMRGDADVLRLTARNEYDYAYLGKARALGVPCDSLHAVSAKPAQAIGDGARGAAAAT